MRARKCGLRSGQGHSIEVRTRRAMTWFDFHKMQKASRGGWGSAYKLEFLNEMVDRAQGRGHDAMLPIDQTKQNSQFEVTKPAKSEG